MMSAKIYRPLWRALRYTGAVGVAVQGTLNLLIGPELFVFPAVMSLAMGHWHTLGE
ncbi:hypothetical protein YW3DRAFT_05858 [Streptomyces sp. MnatMP-M77]|nr:hypothetical protein YW3DRAFT_05858 [Streptomyces sp. MnatMP-M77]